jgi:hypothetical membrane protein
VSTRALLTFGAIGPAIFMITFFIDGATRPGYEPWRNFVSQLSTGERGWVQIANFVLCGVLLLIGTAGLLRTRTSRAVTVLIGVVAVGLVAAGIFVTDPGFGYPPGEWTPSQQTFHDAIHGVMSVIVFFTLSVVAIVVALQAWSSRLWAWYSLLSGLAVFVFITAAARVAAEQERIVSPDAPMGVLQRISIVVGFAWLAAFFVRLRRVNTA